MRKVCWIVLTQGPYLRLKHRIKKKTLSLSRVEFCKFYRFGFMVFYVFRTIKSVKYTEFHSCNHNQICFLSFWITACDVTTTTFWKIAFLAGVLCNFEGKKNFHAIRQCKTLFSCWKLTKWNKADPVGICYAWSSLLLFTSEITQYFGSGDHSNGFYRNWVFRYLLEIPSTFEYHFARSVAPLNQKRVWMAKFSNTLQRNNRNTHRHAWFAKNSWILHQ